MTKTKTEQKKTLTTLLKKDEIDKKCFRYCIFNVYYSPCFSVDHVEKQKCACHDGTEAS